MPIISRVPELASQKFGSKDAINLSDITRDTGLTYASVSSWVKGHVNRADFPVIAKWCKYFDCEVGDLLVYVPGED